MPFFNGLNKRPQLQLQPRAKSPPVFSYVNFAREENTPRFPQDISYSSTLSGVPLFIFGDRFKQRSSSQFLGIAASLGSRTDLNFTRYPYSPTGKDDSGSHVTLFTKEENEFNQSSTRDPRNSGDHYYLWAFNVVIEIPDKPGHGVFWIAKEKSSRPKGINKYYGVGVAEAETNPGVIDGDGAEFAQEMPVARRHGNIISDESSPQWRIVATLLDGDFIYIFLFFLNNLIDFIYIYGTQNKKNYRRNMHRKERGNLAGYKSYIFPDRYTYWDGETFSAALPAYEPNGNGLHLEPVLFVVLPGAIFLTTLFSGTEEGLFTMIGRNGSGNGEIRLKIAENPWGPWRGEGRIVDLGQEDRGIRGIKSCVYAHPRASDSNAGQLSLPWSEPWPGGVGVFKIGSEMVGDDGEEEVQQNVDHGDDDSMSSAVEEHLMGTIGGQTSQEGENAGYDDVGQIPDDEERDTARRRALAKLTRDIESDDYQAYLDDYRVNHDPVVSWDHLFDGTLQIVSGWPTGSGNTSFESHGNVTGLEEAWYHHGSCQVSQENGNQERWEDTEYGDEEPISSAIVEPRRRLKWGKGLKVDVSSASERNTKAQLGVIQTPTMASSCTAWEPTGTPLKQQGSQCTPTHWRTSNRSVMGADGRADGRAGIQGVVASGYSDGQYVTIIRGTQTPESFTESSEETWHEAKGRRAENQQPEPKKSKQWLKAVKKGIQKLMKRGDKKQDGTGFGRGCGRGSFFKKLC